MSDVIGYLPTTISYLEMYKRPAGAPIQPPIGADIVRALQPTVSFYRYLYNTVGGPWLWVDRRLTADDRLADEIQREEIDIRVLWLNGVPAGFCELDLSQPGDVHLAYFGLLPEFIGRGLGKYLLDWTCRHAFHRGTERLSVHTCDLDHPRALSAYEAAGFEVYDREEWLQPVIEGMGIPPHVLGRELQPTN